MRPRVLLPYQRRGLYMRPATMGAIAAAGGTGAGGDPFFANVSALLHLDGVDGGTTFTDVKGHTFSAVGNAQLDTAQKKFGTASLLLDGTGDWIAAPDHADFELGAGDFSIEQWLRFAALPTSGNYQSLAVKWRSVNNRSLHWSLFNNAGTLQLVFQWSTAGTGTDGSASVNWTPSTNTWYFLQCIREATALRFGVDGAQQGTDQAISGTFFNGNAELGIGSDGTGSVNGWIDDFRLTKGVARSIALPSEAFPDF